VVRAQDVRGAQKTALEWGKWQTGGMTPAVFPLSRRRGRSLQFGSAYRWRLIRFQAVGHMFRVLLVYSLEKEQYRAILAREDDRDLSVIASYEFHGTHPGWHVTAACGDILQIPSGVLIGPWQRRMPKARSYQRGARVTFGVENDDHALEAAAGFFRLHKTEGKFL